MAKGEIKAIETVYNGYRFRSRLEARWAVFFDTLEIKYEYENQGYSTGNTRYLPDFWIPDWDCFIEICGELPSAEKWKKVDDFATALYASEDAHHVYLFAGSPWPGEMAILQPGISWYDPDDPVCRTVGYEQIVQCACGWYSVLTDGPYELNVHPIGKHNPKGCGLWRGAITVYRAQDDIDPSDIRRAYTAARQARFEHGETPK